MRHTKADVILKDFWRSNERFADLFNAVMFDGEEVLRPELLEELDTDVSGVIEMRDYKETLTRARDVVKKSAGGVDFVVMGIENQQHVHYAMPLRNMIYDALGYLKEYQELTRPDAKTGTFVSDQKESAAHNGKDEDAGKNISAEEFLSGMRKDDRLHPIVTLTIYYGEKEWDGPHSLKEMMIDMPEELQAVVSDYPLNLLTVRDSGNYTFHNPDVQLVFDISREMMAGHFDEIQEKFGAVTVRPDLLSVIGTIAGNRKLVEIGRGKGIDNMYTALEKLERDNLNLGLEKGIEQGKLFIIRNLLNSGMSAEQVKKTAGVTEEEIKLAQAENRA